MPQVKYHVNVERDYTHIHIYQNGEIIYFYRMQPTANNPNLYFINKYIRTNYISTEGNNVKNKKVWLPEFLAGVPVTCNFKGNLSASLAFIHNLYTKLTKEKKEEITCQYT